MSVIVPAFDAAASIAETLASVGGQTYRNLEVVVVDDGSTDDTVARVAALAERDTRIVLLRQDHGGVAAARNLAIAHATGELIAPLDADDLWEPRKLERQVEALAAAPASVSFVYCWWRNVDSAGRMLYDGPRWRVEGRAFERLVEVNFVGNASIPLIRRAALDEVGGYSERLRRENGQGCEDWDLYLRLAERSELRVVPEILVSYRSHD
ncbi:MAG: glycosyltransferase family 2 protein, partial [Candidatus Binatia bacterium]